MNLSKLSPEVAKDLIELVNSLSGLQKSAAVKYGATNFKYVPLDDILEKIKENHNFAFFQPLGSMSDNTPCIQCILVHKSGEVIASDPYRLVVKESMKKQEEGAEITYSRRYCAASFLGIASDDDVDAQKEKECQRGETRQRKKEEAPRGAEPIPEIGIPATRAEHAKAIRRIGDLCVKKWGAERAGEGFVRYSGYKGLKDIEPEAVGVVYDIISSAPDVL